METPRTIELPSVRLTFLEGDVVHAHFKDGRIGEKSDVEEMFDLISQERNGRKFLLLVSVGPGSALTNEARAYASGEESNRIIAADAIIVRDFGHQMSANAFVRYNRPGRPAQLFPDEDSALKWLAQQHHLIDA
ncbi:MAG TPA: hypothetical protein VHL57_04190 [Flavobacteriales bacterium]|jgi:hypothetical protein|nr:hypothetical protein [Flavobacteriales bacterium]